jgi:site-specific DNA-methyltransferase (adenine-specific)
VTVPTGAFVARRNGKVFVTGNSGFPKSLNVGKALNKIGSNPEAAKWEGFGTALKPAIEIWWMARKPLRAKSVAEQVLATGTGVINIDGCRVVSGPSEGGATSGANAFGQDSGWNPHNNRTTTIDRSLPLGRWPSNLTLQHSPACKVIGTKTVKGDPRGDCEGERPGGFFSPGSEVGSGEPNARVYGDQEVPVYECAPGCPVKALDEQSGTLTSGTGAVKRESSKGYRGNALAADSRPEGTVIPCFGDTGGASRFFNSFEPDPEAPPFFYTGKATTKERNEGLEGFEPQAMHSIDDQSISTQSNRRCKLCGEVKFGQPHCECPEPEWEETAGSKVKNNHPTLKSQKLMRHLVRLVTPKEGVVLDPFAGSGSTLVAAVTEGMRFVGIELSPEYLEIAKARLVTVVEKEEEQRERQDLLADFLPS